MICCRTDGDKIAVRGSRGKCECAEGSDVRHMHWRDGLTRTCRGCERGDFGGQERLKLAAVAQPRIEAVTEILGVRNEARCRCHVTIPLGYCAVIIGGFCLSVEPAARLSAAVREL